MIPAKKRQSFHRPWVRGVVLFLGLLVLPSLASSINIARPISDVAGVMSPEVIAPLEAELKAHFKDTGVQLAVVIVQTTHGVPIEDYSLQLAEAWGGGLAELDSGLLFVMAIKDRRMRVEVGYGLEGLISDARAAHWIDEIKPALRKKDYDGAVRTMVDGLLSDTAGVTPENLADGSLRAPLPIQAMAVYLVILGLLFSTFLRKRVKSRRNQVIWSAGLVAGVGLLGGSAALGIAIAALCYLIVAYLCSMAFWPHWGIEDQKAQDEAVLNASIFARVYAVAALIAIFCMAAAEPDGSEVWHTSTDVLVELFAVLFATTILGGFLGTFFAFAVLFGTPSSSGGTTFSSSDWSSSSSSSWGGGGGGYSGGGGSFGGGGASGSW